LVFGLTRTLLQLVLLGVPGLALCGTPSASLPLSAATPVPTGRVNYVAPSDATASVLVKREGGSSFLPVSQTVLLDGREVATIDEKEFVALDVAPGPHVIGIRATKTEGDPITLSIDAGAYSNYYFRVSRTSTGALVLQRSSGADD
jgi:hypothetical protein